MKCRRLCRPARKLRLTRKAFPYREKGASFDARKKFRGDDLVFPPRDNEIPATSARSRPIIFHCRSKKMSNSGKHPDPTFTFCIPLYLVPAGKVSTIFAVYSCSPVSRCLELGDRIGKEFQNPSAERLAREAYSVNLFYCIKYLCRIVLNIHV